MKKRIIIIVSILGVIYILWMAAFKIYGRYKADDYAKFVAHMCSSVFSEKETATGLLK